MWNGVDGHGGHVQHRNTLVPGEVLAPRGGGHVHDPDHRSRAVHQLRIKPHVGRFAPSHHVGGLPVRGSHHRDRKAKSSRGGRRFRQPQVDTARVPRARSRKAKSQSTEYRTRAIRARTGGGARHEFKIHKGPTRNLDGVHSLAVDFSSKEISTRWWCVHEES